MSKTKIFLLSLTCALCCTLPNSLTAVQENVQEAYEQLDMLYAQLEKLQEDAHYVSCGRRLYGVVPVRTGNNSLQLVIAPLVATLNSAKYLISTFGAASDAAAEALKNIQQAQDLLVAKVLTLNGSQESEHMLETIWQTRKMLKEVFSSLDFIFDPLHPLKRRVEKLLITGIIQILDNIIAALTAQTDEDNEELHNCVTQCDATFPADEQDDEFFSCTDVCQTTFGQTGDSNSKGNAHAIYSISLPTEQAVQPVLQQSTQPSNLEIDKSFAVETCPPVVATGTCKSSESSSSSESEECKPSTATGLCTSIGLPCPCEPCKPCQPCIKPQPCKQSESEKCTPCVTPWPCKPSESSEASESFEFVELSESEYYPCHQPQPSECCVQPEPCEPCEPCHVAKPCSSSSASSDSSESSESSESDRPCRPAPQPYKKSESSQESSSSSSSSESSEHCKPCVRVKATVKPLARISHKPCQQPRTLSLDNESEPSELSELSSEFSDEEGSD